MVEESNRSSRFWAVFSVALRLSRISILSCFSFNLALHSWSATRYLSWNLAKVRFVYASSLSLSLPIFLLMASFLASSSFSRATSFADSPSPPAAGAEAAVPPFLLRASTCSRSLEFSISNRIVFSRIWDTSWLPSMANPSTAPATSSTSTLCLARSSLSSSSYSFLASSAALRRVLRPTSSVDVDLRDSDFSDWSLTAAASFFWS
mmetsp:Transcript_20997/g.58422  ORF Transcript_20997/g.58422 Transcript_20997/m.58422 type:complete len:206 (+) Transcript_20997:111-728(+)